MKDEFTPPIKVRTINDLLKKVGSSEKWNPITFFIILVSIINNKTLIY